MVSLCPVDRDHPLCDFQGDAVRRDVNPFTAMLAAQSLWKRPIKVPNLKSLRLLPPCARAREQNSVKTLSTESRLVIGPSDILLASVYVCRFQPGNLADWGSEGVNVNVPFLRQLPLTSPPLPRWQTLMSGATLSPPQ